MPETELLEDNATNFLVRKPDGRIETKAKDSTLNQLLYGHDLHALIEDGTEVWTSAGLPEEPAVTVTPLEGGAKYTIKLDNSGKVLLGEHRKTDLIDALAELYNERDDQSNAPMIDLYDEMRDDEMRAEVLEPFANLFDVVQERDDGWLINGHLLLTFEGEFYHPSTESRTLGTGRGVVSTGASSEAYDVDVQKQRFHSRTVTRNGKTYRLYDKEITFLGLALWAIENTPDQR